MEKTRIKLLKWFLAMFLMSNDKRGCSAMQLSVKLELCYSTAWFLCHRIRSAMGERDAQYLLSGYIEVDDAFSAHLPVTGNVVEVPTNRLYWWDCR